MIWKSLGWFNQWFKQWQSTSNNIEDICRNNSEISETGTVTFDFRSLKWVGTKNIVFYSGYHVPTKLLSLQKRYLTGSKDRDILQNNYDSRPSFTYDNLSTPHHKSRDHSYLQVYWNIQKRSITCSRERDIHQSIYGPRTCLPYYNLKTPHPKSGEHSYPPLFGNIRQKSLTWSRERDILQNNYCFIARLSRLQSDYTHPKSREHSFPPMFRNLRPKSLTWSKERDILRTTMIHDKNIHITTWQQYTKSQQSVSRPEHPFP